MPRAATLRVVKVFRSRVTAAAVTVLWGGYFLMACTTRAPETTQPPPVASVPSPTPTKQRFTATAFSVEGRTASGHETRPGIVAADPKVLPLGSRIRVSGAGQYSGEYTVADTGRAIKGHDIDIFIADTAEAKRFGRRTVEVEVLGRARR